MSLTQRDRVLNALRNRGHQGLTQVDFHPPRVCDGGEPILRVGARIEELRSEGFVITSGERRQKCVVYRLVREPSVEPPAPEPEAPEAGPGESPQLFPLEFEDCCPPPRSAIYEDAA